MKNDGTARIIDCGGFKLHDEPLRSAASFLDYDGVAIFAGAFEQYQSNPWGHEATCKAVPDLDLREREIVTAFRRDQTIVFLVPYLPDNSGNVQVDYRVDLFRRIAPKFGIHLTCRSHPVPWIESTVPEFQDYVSRFGCGYVSFDFDENHSDWIRPLCVNDSTVYGLVLGGNVFFIPCTTPDNEPQAVTIATLAVAAAIDYRARVSKQLPAWVAGFTFSKETSLRAKSDELQSQIIRLEQDIDRYGAFKGALCYQSDPLVEVVKSLFHRFFGLNLVTDDKCIEDATLPDDDGNVLAVFEVKGISRNFTRNHINQADSHRERLSLPPTTPAILIVNTMMAASSIETKDEAPHPDIVKKAYADRVLLIRTLDLLRFADGIEKGSFTKPEFKAILLNKAGWLKVEDDTFEIVGCSESD
ncbi:MAG TPA: hypothetical protein VGM76_10075 [Lacipirellulaceae bacterium]